MKHCRKCSRDKSLDDFYRNRSTFDGKSAYCRDCTKAYMRDQAVKHADRIAKYEEANRVTRRAKARAKYAANRQSEIARVRDYRARNPEKVRELNRKRSQNNPEAERMRCAKRRARQRDLPAFKITDRDMRRLYGSPCAVAGCGAVDIEADHVIPIARGGSHGIGNLHSLCRSHNAMKRDKTWIEFRVYLASLNTIAA